MYEIHTTYKHYNFQKLLHKMGGSSSKSPFERRNSVERRTQRRTLADIKSKYQKLQKELKAFKGVPDDEQYNHIKASLTSLKKETARKSASVQPKLRESYNDMNRQITEALQYLDAKAVANRDKTINRSSTEQATSKEDAHDGASSIQRQSSVPPLSPGANSEIRKTVELKLVQITPQIDRQSIMSTSTVNSAVKSPEDKRKSILKMGVPVMPMAVMERQSARVSIVTAKNEEQSLAATIEKIRKDVEDIELQISTFIGIKNGTHYNRLKEKLFGYLDKLSAIAVKEDDLLERKEKCVNYVKSCLNFLDEKAIDGDTNGDDDVFASGAANNDNINTLSKKFAITQI